MENEVSSPSISSVAEASSSFGSGIATAKKMDRFCWMCHFENVDISCNSCSRSFHTECVNRLENFPKAILHEIKMTDGSDDTVVELVQCQECMVADQELLEPMRCLKIDEKMVLFTAICDTWKRYWKLSKQPTPLDARYFKDEYMEYLGTVAKPMDLNTLATLVNNGEIRTMAGLAGEMKWIYHNSMFFNGALARDTVDIAAFQQNCFDQLNRMIASCLDCEVLLSTKREDELLEKGKFLALCKTPHVVAWVKTTGYPYWPAKIVHADLKYVEAIGFGDHKRLFGTLDKCFVYSKKQPPQNGCQKRMTREDAEELKTRLKAAIAEANRYVEALVESDFGAMNLHLEATSPLEKLTPRFVSSIFPKMKKSLKQKVVEEMVVEFKEFF